MKTGILTTFGAALALTLVASPAAAADLATIGCVNDTVTPQVRTAFTNSARTLVGDTEVAPVTQETRDALDAAVAACAKRFKWSPEAADAAKYVFMSEAGLPEIRKAAVAAKIDPDAVIAALGDLTPEQAAKLGEGDEDSVTAFMGAVQKRGVPMTDDKQMQVVFALTLMAGRRNLERARFAAN